MAKVFLQTCFAPFNPKERPFTSSYFSPSHKADDEASVFISSIILDLHDLERSLEVGSVSLQWCRKAMILVRKMHSHFLLTLERLFEEFDSWDQANMIEDYLRESLDILDLCNLLKSSILGFNRWRLMVGFSMKRPYGDGDVMTVMEMVDRKKRGNIVGKSFDVKRWMEKSSCKIGAAAKIKMKDCRKLMDIMGVIQSAITMICLLVFSSVIQPVPIKVDARQVCHKLQLLNSFSVSIQKLVSSFIERFKVGENQRLMLSEIEKNDSAIAELQAQIGTAADNEQMARDERSVTSGEKLRRRSVDLKEGLDLFESMVDEVFDDFIKGRKRVLSLITTSITPCLK